LLRRFSYAAAPWHFLNFLPLPHGQGSFLPTPAYGFVAKAGSAIPGWLRCTEGGGGSAAVTRPSAAGLEATMGV